jgi:hypothetical protein
VRRAATSSSAIRRSGPVAGNGGRFRRRPVVPRTRTPRANRPSQHASERAWGTVRRGAYCARFGLSAIDEGGPTMWVRVATFEGGDTEKLDKLMDERM